MANMNHHIETRHLHQLHSERPLHGKAEIPQILTEITPYERIRELDTYYEHLKDLEKLSENDLEQKIENYQNLSEFIEYRELYLNFHTMDEAIEQFAYSQGGQENPDLTAEMKKIVEEIKNSVANYYKAVMTFDRTSINKFRMSDSEYKESMIQVDQRRTIAHNKLIDDVVSYTRMLNKTIPEKIGYRFDKETMFDPHLIQDLRSKEKNLHKPAREKIANWAFLNERGIHVEKAVEKAQQVLESKKAA
jgi:hypothetical protein